MPPSAVAAAMLKFRKKSPQSETPTRARSQATTEKLRSIFRHLADSSDEEIEDYDPNTQSLSQYAEQQHGQGHLPTCDAGKQRAEFIATYEGLSQEQKKAVVRLAGILTLAPYQSWLLLKKHEWSQVASAEAFMSSTSAAAEVITSILVEAQRIELVQQMEEILGISERRAVELLRMNDWNLQPAMDQHLTMPDLDDIPTGGVDNVPSAPSPEGSRSGSEGESTESAGLDDEDPPVGILIEDISDELPSIPENVVEAGNTNHGVPPPQIENLFDSLAMVSPLPTPQQPSLEWPGVDVWLAHHGLSHYGHVFLEQELTDPHQIALLTASDLSEMGIGTVGARKKAEIAIAELRSRYSA